jgi:hypothetical protein
VCADTCVMCVLCVCVLTRGRGGGSSLFGTLSGNTREILHKMSVEVSMPQLIASH